LIVGTPGPDRELLPAIISSTGLTMIAVGSRDDTWTLQMSARALQRLCEAGVDVLMFSQSFSEHSLNLMVREQDQTHCLNILCREFGGHSPREWADLPLNGQSTDRGTFRELGGTCSLGTKEKVATISVVGVADVVGAPGLIGAPGVNTGSGTEVPGDAAQVTAPGHTGSIVSHAFAALGRHGIRVIAVAQAATEHSVSFCIPEDQMADTVRFLHGELGLEDR
jgi:hypothetical protein